jgi:ABC-type branched-subunit amino acid transport system ATPase component
MAQEPDGFLASIGLKRQAKRLARAAKAAVTDAPSSSSRVSDVVALSPSAATAQAELEVRGLSAGYNDVAVLHDIDLSVSRGEFFAIVGANGAGKSTLCSAIGGTVAARAGRILLNGIDITALAAHQRFARGLIVAPEYRGVFPGLTVEENVAVTIADPARRREALAAFPVLLERRNQPARLLSGGEQQMLTLAALLASPPSVVIVDEPVLGLAPIVASRVFDALRELRDRGTTVVLAEEQITRAMAVADRVALLEVGRIKWQGPIGDVTSDLLGDLYLGASQPRHARPLV